MKNEIKKYLFDIHEAIKSIDVYLGDKKDFNDYCQTKMLRRAVERELEIVGEAMSHILKLEPAIGIQNGRRIIDLRNMVIHGYDSVDNVIIWGILSRYLPILKEEVTELLNMDTDPTPNKPDEHQPQN